jgi:hypothetical protein
MAGCWQSERAVRRAGIVAILLLAACASPPPKGSEKIHFDPKALDAAGFEGPPAGKREVAYEFCIPNTLERRVEVLELEPTARFESAVAGRAGCTGDEILVHARTGAPNWRGRLLAVAALPYVKAIRRTPIPPVAQP